MHCTLAYRAYLFNRLVSIYGSLVKALNARNYSPDLEQSVQNWFKYGCYPTSGGLIQFEPIAHSLCMQLQQELNSLLQLVGLPHPTELHSPRLYLDMILKVNLIPFHQFARHVGIQPHFLNQWIRGSIRLQTGYINDILCQWVELFREYEFSHVIRSTQKKKTPKDAKVLCKIDSRTLLLEERPLLDLRLED